MARLPCSRRVVDLARAPKDKARSAPDWVHVCSTLLGAVAVFLLAFGIVGVAHGVRSTGGVIDSGDLVATGATMMTAALLSWLALARPATRPARNLTVPET